MMDTQSEEEEKMIPVLTVKKNKAILKNIFLFITKNGEKEENLIMGRSPDCDITLSHPSISRFHIRLLVRQSSKPTLSVIDLSSVHGTWVMGKKIEPNVRVKLNEGDTMQLGGSSRVYILHWVPFSQVYDIENPFVSPSAGCLQAEDKGQEGILEGDYGHHENKRVQSLDDDNSEASDYEVSNEKSRLFLINEIPMISFSEKDADSKSIADKELSWGIISNSFSEQLATESETETETSSWFDEILSETEIQQFANDRKISQKLVNRESEQDLEFLENSASLCCKKYTETPVSAIFNLFSETEIEQLDKESKSQKENMGTPPKNKTTSKTDQGKRMSPSISSEEFAIGYGISSFSDEILLETGSLQFDEDKASTKVLVHKELEHNVDLLESLASLFSHELSDHSCSPDVKILPEVESKEGNKENESREGNKENESHEGNISTPLVKTGYVISSFSDEILLNTRNQQFVEDEASTKVPVHKELQQNLDFLESLASLFSHELNEHSFSPDRKVLLEVESQQVNKENESQEENTPTHLVKVDKQFSSSNHWSRRCNPSSVLRIKTSGIRETSKKVDIKFETDLSDPGEIENHEVTNSFSSSSDAAEEASTPDKENCTSNTLALNLMQYNSFSAERKEETSKYHFTDLHENNEQFTPDKENFTPNTLLTRSMMKKNKMKDTSGSNLYISSSLEHIVSGPIEEIPSPKSTRSSSRNPRDTKLKSGTENNSAKRDPFQPLFEYSGMNRSEASTLSSTNKSCNITEHVKPIEVKENIREDKRKWRMIVDTNCLLDSESRKALHILQGLKGTELIIPRTVIRELDSMNRQGSFFRRRTESSCALQWIKECMANTDWWIHVESSDKEPMPIAPTPPSIPESRFSEVLRRSCGGTASSVFISLGSLFEIVSPTANDNTLEYALQLRGNGNDGKLVLLSNDVTVKIKAMAEGLMCETVHDFRESLVNPFSERFLWNGSSPRGLTWSCMDDFILKEKFYGHSNKLGAEEGPKGLKLIVLHNTGYAFQLRVKTV